MSTLLLIIFLLRLLSPEILRYHNLSCLHSPIDFIFSPEAHFIKNKIHRSVIYISYESFKPYFPSYELLTCSEEIPLVPVTISVHLSWLLCLLQLSYTARQADTALIYHSTYQVRTIFMTAQTSYTCHLLSLQGLGLVHSTVDPASAIVCIDQTP